MKLNQIIYYVMYHVNDDKSSARIMIWQHINWYIIDSCLNHVQNALMNTFKAFPNSHKFIVSGSGSARFISDPTEIKIYCFIMSTIET